mmetsp:Transcript_42769/g.114459  ORF Transcript_42769/g.114459 Transcript_42769/m.114459 type:complete len:219 (+) Transcript_42769:2087-2743(+)
MFDPVVDQPLEHRDVEVVLPDKLVAVHLRPELLVVADHHQPLNPRSEAREQLALKHLSSLLHNHDARPNLLQHRPSQCCARNGHAHHLNRPKDVRLMIVVQLLDGTRGVIVPCEMNIKRTRPIAVQLLNPAADKASTLVRVKIPQLRALSKARLDGLPTHLRQVHRLMQELFAFVKLNEVRFVPFLCCCLAGDAFGFFVFQIRLGNACPVVGQSCWGA